MIFYQIILCKTSANVYGIYNKIKILLCIMNNWKGKLHATRRIKGKIQPENVCGTLRIRRDV